MSNPERYSKAYFSEPSSCELRGSKGFLSERDDVTEETNLGESGDSVDTAL